MYLKSWPYLTNLLVFSCFLSTDRAHGRAIADYDSAIYEDIIENKDGTLFKNIDAGFETALKDESENERAGKFKRSDTSGEPIEVVMQRSQLYNSERPLNNANQDELEAINEDPERMRKCCGCDLSYLKTFPPNCPTTCAYCQETCPASGLPKPLPGTCSMLH